MSSTVSSSDSAQLKSHKAYREILDWIREGRYNAGERLPSERDLAQRLGLNHLTVRRGLAKLVHEGVIEKRPNVGNFVAESTAVTPLAVVLPEYLHGSSIGHPWTGLLMAGACAALDPMRFSLSTLFYKSGRLWEDTGRALMNAQVRGVLLVPDSSVQLAHVKRLMDQGVRIVMLRDVPALATLGLPVVQADHEMAIVQLLHGLAERGHRRVRVAVYKYDPTRQANLAALRIALEQTGLGTLDRVVLELDNPADAAPAHTYQPMSQALQSTDRPTAIIVPDEFAAADLFQACYRMGIRVPHDLSIAAVIDQTPHAHPVPLTAPDSLRVSQMVGRIAAEQLIGLVQGEEMPQRHVRLRNEVVWRDSVAPVEGSCS